MDPQKEKFSIYILTLFPEMFPGTLQHSIAGKALKDNKWQIEVFNLRDFATDKNKTVDDRPFGGGAGMLIKPDIISRAIDYIKQNYIINDIYYLSPAGEIFNQTIACDLVKKNNILFICGRYEGIDCRVIKKYKIKELSIGDYILSGGEVALLTILDCCIRIIPDVIQNEVAHAEESFALNSKYKYLLEYSQYTRPKEWCNMKVPDVLLSGNHEEIAKFRLKEAENITKKRRPDLWKKYIKDLK